MRVEHEDIDPLAPGDRIYCRAARIAAGGAYDGQVILALEQKMLEQAAQQLQRHVLEGERGPVEQFEKPVLLVELHQRRHRRMAEAAIGSLAQIA